MRRTLLLMALAAMTSVAALAGGLMTNTNYHIAFDRMMARGATFDIDAAYSNPAGLVWGYSGFQLSVDFQKPWQNRDIETTVSGVTQKYPGKASAPIVPALFASYHKDRWAVSAMVGIVGSGGFVKYDDGVPMFNVPIQGMMAQNSLSPEYYTLDSEMKGKQYIYGGQLNFSYRLLDCLSAAVGLRANYYDGYYRGHVAATTIEALGSQRLLDMRLDVAQRGWGFAPIVGVNYHKGPLTLAARYEFRTKISVPNDTKELSLSSANEQLDINAMARQVGSERVVAALTQTLGTTGQKVANYLPDERVRYDMPALLAAAVGYAFTSKLRATLEYHYFDDKHAKMADDRQETLTHGTHEVLAGVEYDINRKFTVSCGAQRTDYGLSDDYQQNTSFACDSYSLGLGGAWNITDKVRLNAGYFITLYSDYTKQTTQQRDGYPGTDVYSRTNNVVGLGVDFKF